MTDKCAAPNIYLIGPMAAGKSTIGKLLARELARPFYDSDQEIEAMTGVSVAWIFDVEGEDGFNKREESMVEELTQIEQIVLATGGGTILSPKCRKVLRSTGYIVYLSVSLEEQVNRTLRDKHRPLIQTKDRKAALEKLYAEREPLYKELANWSCQTDSGPGTKIVQEIYEHLKTQFDV